MTYKVFRKQFLVIKCKFKDMSQFRQFSLSLKVDYFEILYTLPLMNNNILCMYFPKITINDVITPVTSNKIKSAQ